MAGFQGCIKCTNARPGRRHNFPLLRPLRIDPAATAAAGGSGPGRAGMAPAAGVRGREGAAREAHTAAGIAGRVRRGEAAAAEVCRAWTQRLAAREPRVRSFLHVAAAPDVERQAARLDRMLAEGGPGALDHLPLAGVPVGVKDNLCVEGMPATAGSRLLEGYVPPADATAVARLRAAGAIVLGKTNMDEFGMGSTTENSGFHATNNPWGAGRVPGGSSGGSGAAVAAGQVAAALGSDTGGSVRLPAAFCGVVGLKPTYGRVSRAGLLAYGSSLDAVGPMAATVEDCALLLSVLAGADPLDATCSTRPPPALAAAVPEVDALGSRPLAGRRVAVLRATLGEGVGAEVAAKVREAAAHLEALGAAVDEIDVGNLEAGLEAYYILACSEASSNLARYDGLRYGRREGRASADATFAATRGAGFGPEVKRRILMGTYALSTGSYAAYFRKAQQVRQLIRRDLEAALATYDALISPVAPTVAYEAGGFKEPLEMYLGDLMTVNVNLAGLPALSVPCGTAAVGGGAALPVGLQLIGRRFGEAPLLALGHVYERTRGLPADALVPPGFELEL